MPDFSATSRTAIEQAVHLGLGEHSDASIDAHIRHIQAQDSVRSQHWPPVPPAHNSRPRNIASRCILFFIARALSRSPGCSLGLVSPQPAETVDAAAEKGPDDGDDRREAGCVPELEAADEEGAEGAEAAAASDGEKPAVEGDKKESDDKKPADKKAAETKK